jgi:hypothetical protein
MRRIRQQPNPAREATRSECARVGNAGDESRGEGLPDTRERIKALVSARAFLGLTSRFQYQISNRLGLRDEGNVTGLDLDRFRAHALCHEALKIRVDRPILRRHGVPAWLRSPCRVRGFTCEQFLMKRPLDRVKRLRLCFGQVAREISEESFFAEASFIAIEYDAGRRGWRRKRLGQRGVIFAGIRCAQRPTKRTRLSAGSTSFSPMPVSRLLNPFWNGKTQTGTIRSMSI